MASINLNDVNACKTAYLDYCAGKTNGISKADIKEIETKYQSQLKGWKMESAKDTNAYEIEDEESGSQKAKSKKASNKSSNSLKMGAAKAIGGVAVTKIANDAAIKGVYKDGCIFVDPATGGQVYPSGSWGGTETFEALNPNCEVANNAAKKANNTSAIGFMVECTLGLATGIAYQASKANQSEHAELMELEGEMKEYLSNLEEEQEVMAEDGEKLEELSEQSQEIGEETADNIEELQKEYDEKVARQEELAAKAESGEALTEEEKAEYEQLGGEISELGDKIATIKDDSSDKIESVSDETEEIQTDLDETADAVETIQDKADYAESFDKDTKKACIMESVAQGLNVASSTKGAVNAFNFAASGATLFGSTLWANAFGAMGVAGATMSGLGVIEQAKWAKDIGGEIDVRKQVQALNAETQEALDVNVDSVETTVTDVEEASTNIESIPEVPEEEPAALPPVQTEPESETKTETEEKDEKKLKEDKPVQ